MRKLTLFEVLSDVLMPDRHHTSRALVRFLFAFVSLEWLVHSTTRIVERFGASFVHETHAPEALPLSRLAAEAVGPLAAFLLAVAWISWARIRYLRRRPGSPPVYGVPPQSRGLIVFLSDYRPYQSALATPDDVLARARREPGLMEIGDFRKQMLQSNWGPLCAAAQYHGPALEACWLICTEGPRGSTGQYEAACAAVRQLIGKDIRFYKFVLTDHSSVEQASIVVRSVYDVGLPAAGLESDAVVADFTSGTAAMTGGMVLATLSHANRVEYVRQGVELHVLTPGEIAQQKILIEVPTSHEMVAFERRLEHSATGTWTPRF